MREFSKKPENGASLVRALSFGAVNREQGDGTDDPCTGTHPKRRIAFRASGWAFITHGGSQSCQLLHDRLLDGVHPLKHLDLTAFEYGADLRPNIPLAFGSNAPERVNLGNRPLLCDGISPTLRGRDDR